MGWGSDDYDSVDSGTDVASAAQSTSESYNDNRNESDDSPYDTSTVGMGTNTMGGDEQAAVAAAYDYGPSRGIVAPSYGGPDYFDDRYYASTVPVTRRSPVSTDNQNYVPLARDYTQADLDKEKRALDQAKSEAYSEKQFGFDLGQFRGPFGMYERIADAILDPTASLANAIAERGVAKYSGQNVPSGVANYAPQGLSIADVGGPLSQGGRVAAYDPSINAMYDTSPFANINPFGQKMPQQIRDLYNQKAEVARQAEIGGDSEQPKPLLIPEEEVAETREPMQYPEFTPREYKYQPYLGKFYSIPSRFTQPYGLLG